MAGGKGKGFDYVPGEPLLTGIEAAEVLDVTPRTCAKWARLGKLRAVRLVGTWGYPERSVRRLAKARKRGA
jgi:predicted site-specific integrase-resolvase